MIAPLFSPSPYPNGYRLGQGVRIMFVSLLVCLSACISSSSSSSVSLEEGSSQTYYAIQNVFCDHSNTKLDRIMWYTTFWRPMSANSKMVRYISVALLVFKWATKIFIVYLGQIYSDQWTYSCYTDILFKGLGVYCLMWHFLFTQNWIKTEKI